MAPHRHHSSSTEYVHRANFLFTPISSPPYILGSRYRKNHLNGSCTKLSSRAGSYSLSDSEDGISPILMDTESEDEDLSINRMKCSLVSRKPKFISTSAPGIGAGETETEVDEPSKLLPTARIVPQSEPIIPLPTLQRLIPRLFELARWLSILPASAGFIWCILCSLHPPSPSNFSHSTRTPPQTIDYLLASLWTLLTAHQVLAMTSGLLQRWSLYYPPLSTLIRLLALQSICWPLTHLTFLLLDGGTRPVTAWAVIATFTSISRGVQIWVTSNLWWSKTSSNGGHESGYWRRVVGGGTWGGRRWDWHEVGAKCLLPIGVLYFLMAWVGELRREWD